MAWTLRRTIFGFLVLLLLSIVSRSACESSTQDFIDCQDTVKNWAAASSSSSTTTVNVNDKLILKDLLFFLHIPRTGGRTYFQCFLRKMYANSHECPRSYDKLRFDPRKPNCRLMVTHDDYSLMSKLPKERTSVVTILRNPIDRVFSTYEFSVEVAARFLVHPNLTSATQMSGRLRSKLRGVSTLEIWPWKYLVPWMREDLFTRRDVSRFVRSTRTKGDSNPYDMEDMVMPLHAYINDPVAHDIIHNGATFQVAGLTNNSYLGESHKIRHCLRMHPSLGQYVLEIAKDRLEHMLYVGLTEDHEESAKMFANMVGAQVLSQSEALSSHVEHKASNTTEMSTTEDEADASNHDQNSSNSLAGGVPSPTEAKTTNQNMTVDTLMEAYGGCISNLRKSQAARRTMSLKKVAPVNFSKEARLSVPESVLQEILTLNSLDVELYKHAQDIFLQQQQHFIQHERKILIQQRNTFLADVALQGRRSNLDDCTPWKLYSLAVSSFLFIIVLFLIVTARRRTSKVKI
ncbi:protein-tyrosine sulfotransferase [Iris pallida]|uniref:Protein-tyrosine sulfotransferase n=1 Tax=Iris pallida TaxID=29817 RepID=A0AAX6GXU8_IRIPA|nr:protein-tyrosine sulfotransferase [Iris pallida]